MRRTLRPPMARRRSRVLSSSALVLALLLLYLGCYFVFGVGFYRSFSPAPLLVQDSGLASEDEAAAAAAIGASGSRVGGTEAHGEPVQQEEGSATGPAAVAAAAVANDDPVSAFERQVERQLARQPSLVFSRARLADRAARSFSCGGTKTVKLNSPRELHKEHPGLESLLPARDPLQNRSFASCAVVGNSGVLLSTQFGEAIDEHEVVIRFNAAVTEGYEAFVGSKVRTPSPSLARNFSSRDVTSPGI